MEIEVKSTQIIDRQKETILQKGVASIKQCEKGTLLLWDILDEGLHVQMILLQNKILLKKPNQNMTFELGKTTKSMLQTPYGNLEMQITTKHMEIIKQNENISKIILYYQIEIENTSGYENQIEITIR